MSDSELSGNDSEGSLRETPPPEPAQPHSALRGPLILARMVVDALAKKKQGDSKDYNAIIDHLSLAEMKPVVMRRWLQALRLCVAELDKEFDLLVGATLRLKWFDKEPDIIELFKEYLANLISAQTYYLSSVLQSLLKQLWSPSPAPPLDTVHASTHDVIHTILALVPSAPSVLMPLLSKSYPFKGRSCEIQELALRNVLHITSYCPTLTDEILHLVIHQMLSIDVEVPRLDDLGEQEAMSDQEEEEEEEEEGTQFELENIGGGCHDDEAPPISPSLTATYCQKSLMKNEVAEKLDVMMMVMFEYLHSSCFHNGAFVLDAAVTVFQTALKIFEQVILPTHACSHVQFLIFHLASIHEAFPGYFLDYLWDKFQDFNTPAVLRQTVAAYIGSFVARAKFVDLATTKLCLTVIVNWIHQYLDGVCADSLKPDLSQHGSFYALCQALFYIFVFRHKQILDSDGGAVFLQKLNFDKVVTSRLNPLKICLPTVVEMFATLTSHYEIVFCFTIIEQNKRLILSSQPGSAPPTGGVASAPSNLLDCFFPFDPYALKRSAKYVTLLYQEWEDCEEITAKEDDDVSSMASSLHSQAALPSSLESSFTHSMPTTLGFSPPLPR